MMMILGGRVMSLSSCVKYDDTLKRRIIFHKELSITVTKPRTKVLIVRFSGFGWPCLLAEYFEYSNRVAYPFKCTGRRPVVFYLCWQKSEYPPQFCVPSSPAIISHALRGLPPIIKVDSLCVVALAIKFLFNVIETNTPVGGSSFLNR